MKITISGSDEDIEQIASEIQTLLNTGFDRDVVLHSTHTVHAPHAREKGYVSIYVNHPGDQS